MIYYLAWLSLEFGLGELSYFPLEVVHGECDLLDVLLVVLAAEAVHLHLVVLRLHFDLVHFLEGLQRLLEGVPAPEHQLPQQLVLGLVLGLVHAQDVLDLGLHPQVQRGCDPGLLPQLPEALAQLLGLLLGVAPPALHLRDLLVVVEPRDPRLHYLHAPLHLFLLHDLFADALVVLLDPAQLGLQVVQRLHLLLALRLQPLYLAFQRLHLLLHLRLDCPDLALQLPHFLLHVLLALERAEDRLPLLHLLLEADRVLPDLGDLLLVGDQLLLERLLVLFPLLNGCLALVELVERVPDLFLMPQSPVFGLSLQQLVRVESGNVFKPLLRLLLGPELLGLLLLLRLDFHLLQLLRVHRGHWRHSGGLLCCVLVDLLPEFLEFVGCDVPVVLVGPDDVVEPDCGLLVLLAGDALVGLELPDALVVPGEGGDEQALRVVGEHGVAELSCEVEVVLEEVLVDGHRQHISSVLLPAAGQRRVRPLLARPALQPLLLLPPLLGRRGSALRLLAALRRAQLVDDQQQELPEEGHGGRHQLVELELRLQLLEEVLVELGHGAEALRLAGKRLHLAGVHLQELQQPQRDQEHFLGADVLQRLDVLGQREVVPQRSDQHAVRFLHNLQCSSSIQITLSLVSGRVRDCPTRRLLRLLVPALLGLQLLDVAAVLDVAALELCVELRLEWLHGGALVDCQPRELLLQALLFLHAIQTNGYYSSVNHLTTRTLRRPSKAVLLLNSATRSSFSLFSRANAWILPSRPSLSRPSSWFCAFSVRFSSCSSAFSTRSASISLRRRASSSSGCLAGEASWSLAMEHMVFLALLARSPISSKLYICFMLYGSSYSTASCTSLPCSSVAALSAAGAGALLTMTCLSILASSCARLLSIESRNWCWMAKRGGLGCGKRWAARRARLLRMTCALTAHCSVARLKMSCRNSGWKSDCACLLLSTNWRLFCASRWKSSITCRPSAVSSPASACPPSFVSASKSEQKPCLRRRSSQSNILQCMQPVKLSKKLRACGLSSRAVRWPATAKC